MAKIVWTAKALSWLQEIHNYIKENNPLAANKVINGIYEKVQLLNIFPELGYVYQRQSDKNVRILMYGHYRIAYFNKNDTIHILGIFHGSLEIQNYLTTETIEE